MIQNQGFSTVLKRYLKDAAPLFIATQEEGLGRLYEKAKGEILNLIRDADVVRRDKVDVE